MKIEFEWQLIDHCELTHKSLWRAKVFGGWILSKAVYKEGNFTLQEVLFFIPDENHEWEIVKP